MLRTRNLRLSVPKASNAPESNVEEIATPERRTIDEVTRFLKVTPDHLLKSILVMSDNGPVLALVRGDQTLHEKKLAKLIGPHRPGQKDEVKAALGVPAGFIGPMGHKIRKIADPVLKQGAYIAGANKEGFHLRGVTAEKHFTDAEFADIHTAVGRRRLQPVRQAAQDRAGHRDREHFQAGHQVLRPAQGELP